MLTRVLKSIIEQIKEAKRIFLKSGLGYSIVPKIWGRLVMKKYLHIRDEKILTLLFNANTKYVTFTALERLCGGLHYNSIKASVLKMEELKFVSRRAAKVGEDFTGTLWKVNPDYNVFIEYERILDDLANNPLECKDQELDEFFSDLA